MIRTSGSAEISSGIGAKRSGRQRLAVLRQPGVGVAEPAVLDAHDVPRRAAISMPAQAGHVALGHPDIGSMEPAVVQHVAALAAGAADDQHLARRRSVVRA